MLVDSIAKKVAFIDAVLNVIALTSGNQPSGHDAPGRQTPIRTLRSRGEELAADPDERERWPAVTARAVASLAELVELAFPLLRLGGWLVAWKRGEVAHELGDELHVAERAAEALGGGTFDVEDAGVSALPGHRLVFIQKDRPTGAEWPRDPAARRRRPW
jgi:16S rRNA (guanine527-N7)-methyltransferase